MPLDTRVSKTEETANRDGKAPACNLKRKMVPVWLRCRNGKGNSGTQR